MSDLRTHLLGTRLLRFAAPLLPGVVFRGPQHDAAGAPLLHLTFDDGPDPDGLLLLLDLLDAHAARATFFLLGERAARHPALVRAASERGHGVGSHGWAHADPWRQSAAATLADFAHAEAALEDATGGPVRAVRPPYGHITPALARWCRESDRSLVLWELMPGDFLASSPSDRVARRILRYARQGSVVALHEGGRAASVTPAALTLALPQLHDAGWRFDVPLLPSLPEARACPPLSSPASLSR